MRKALDAFSTVDYNLKRRPTQIDNQRLSQSYVFPIWKRRAEIADRWLLNRRSKIERKRRKEDDRNKLSEEERIIKKRKIITRKKVNVKEDKAKEFYLSWYSEIKNDI